MPYRRRRGCHQTFEAGDTVVRLRLRKSFRQPCVPVDIEKAMGWDPNAQRHTTHAAPPPPVSNSHAHQVPPPPKPQSMQDAQLGVLLAAENAIKRKVAETPALRVDIREHKGCSCAACTYAAALKTYNGCKALRPGTPQEGELALKMALKKVLDVVF